jgi:hypothetical protein
MTQLPRPLPGFGPSEPARVAKHLPGLSPGLSPSLPSDPTAVTVSQACISKLHAQITAVVTTWMAEAASERSNEYPAGAAVQKAFCRLKGVEESLTEKHSTVAEAVSQRDWHRVSQQALLMMKLEAEQAGAVVELLASTRSL